VGRAWTVFPDGVSGMGDMSGMSGVRNALDALERGEVTAGGRGLSMQGLVLSKLRGVRRRVMRIGGKNRKEGISKNSQSGGSEAP